ncbi:MAG: 4-(cytidine 5'-diphospho)-2-C-methyl-D-erythritol kinase [Cyanobacteriota bacterium]|nr:4-(cytidine 5'-diphospho)-2-C-methyl-D-erythritol kinase [Cyanobacteriota bacterium]
MADLRVFAPAKINLHLEVLGLRPDGFHELAMLMQSIDLVDELRLANTADGAISLSCDQPRLSCGDDNLIVRAAERLRRHVGLPELGARIHLSKRIPVGAGLAGGSSDGAAALVGLATLWGLQLPADELHGLAAGLGSDVPFCLAGGCQLCFGRGERLEPVPANAGSTPALLLIKHPDSSVSTPWAYGRCRELRGDFYLVEEADFDQRRQALRQGPLLAALRGERPLPPLRNDLQGVVEPEVPSVAAGLELLRSAPGALAVAMSGSGPSLFSLHADWDAAAAAHRHLADQLEVGGFEAWCCGFRRGGVSLEPAAAC